MSNIKKIIGVLLALVMTLSMAAVAFAADGDKYSITITSDKTTLEAGQSATVTVKLTANYNVSAISIPVFFDKSKVTVDAGSTTVEGASIVTEDSESVDSQIYNGSGLSKDQYGVRALVMVPEWGQSIKQYTDETVMTFTVTPADGASGAVVFECVDASVKTTAKPGGSLYVGRNSSGKDTVDSNAEVIDDYDISKANTTITLGSSSEPADLELTSSATAGIVIDAKKTFGGEYDGAVYGFTQAAANTFMTNAYLTKNLQATNSGTLEFARPNGKTSGGFGTGSLVKVKNADGNLSKTYVVVIFGDVDQNGMITAADTTTLKGWATKPASAPANNTVLRMAANTAFVNNATILHNIQTNDTTALKNYVTKNAKANTDLLKLNPVKLAEAQNNFTTFYK